MKNLLLIAFTTLLLQPFTASADVCDKDEIIKLMAERNYIDLKDNSFCVDFGNFPNVRVKMAEGSYDLNGQRNLNDKLKGQDESIKRLVTLLNSTETLAAGQKFTIQTKGIADGTFNSSADQDGSILKELADAKGVITPAKIAAIVGGSDAEGSKAILEEIAKLNSAAKKPEDAGLKFSDIKDDSRLKSMIRNFYLARSRGDKLCSDIFGANGKCDSKGEISPSLDSGKHCFDGCCDQRRGAIVDIVAPQKELMSVGGNGNYKAPFKTPSRAYQGKLQMAASMSVFDLPIREDVTLENNILYKRQFAENYEKDHQRFKEALAGTGCENNAFAIDSVRRIYWTVKGMKDRVSPELYSAIQKNDFKKVYAIYEDANSKFKEDDLNVLSALFSGGNTNVALNNSRGNCPRIQDRGQDWGEDYRSIRVGKSPYTKCAVITEAPALQGKSIDDIHRMLDSKDQSVYVIQDIEARNNFYVYDRTTNTKTQFSFDQKSPDCQNLGVSAGWKPAKNVVRRDDAITTNCIQNITKTGFKMPNEFYAQAPKLNSVVPSDSLNCLNVSKAIDHEMADQNPNGEPVISKEAETSQKAFCKVQSNNVLNMNIDPKDLTVVGGQAQGKQGFMCTGCGSGVQYDAKTKKFKYQARQEDRQINGAKGNQKAMAAKTWSEGASNNSHPLTMASVKHLRSYVIPNCGTSCEDACACLRGGNIEARLKDPGVNVMDFSDLTAGNKKLVGSYPGDKPGSFACIYTPPVPHTCSYNPLGATNDEDHSLDHGEDKCPITEQLKAMPKTSKVVVTNDMINYYKKSCAQVSFPATEDQCSSINGGVMCKKKRSANNCAEPSSKPAAKASKTVTQ